MSAPRQAGRLAYSLLCSIMGFGAALVTMAISQGLGALAGGCSWIGVCLSPGRIPWALVNEPGVAFAYSRAALGYWLAPVLLPLLFFTFLALTMRWRGSWPASIALAQFGWSSSVMAPAILEIAEGKEGHLGRFLDLADVNPLAIWAVLFPAVVAALISTAIMLIQLAADKPASAAKRVLFIGAHLGGATAIWLALERLARGKLSKEVVIASAVPLASALLFAWVKPGQRRGWRIKEISSASWVRMVLASLLVWALCAVAGGPSFVGGWRAVLWSAPGPTNNIRSWMKPVYISDLVGLEER